MPGKSEAAAASKKAAPKIKASKAGKVKAMEAAKAKSKAKAAAGGEKTTTKKKKQEQSDLLVRAQKLYFAACKAAGTNGEDGLSKEDLAKKLKKNELMTLLVEAGGVAAVKKVDLNGDGKITSREVLKAMDADGDGFVSYAEFIGSFFKICGLNSRGKADADLTDEERFSARLREIFDAADADGDEELTKKELKKKLDSNALIALVIEAGGIRALEALDENGDGKISATEIYEAFDLMEEDEDDSDEEDTPECVDWEDFQCGFFELVGLENPDDEPDRFFKGRVFSDRLEELFDDADEGDAKGRGEDDGFLTKKELRKHMDGSALMALVVEAGGARALEKLDPDGDGKITPDEIYKVLGLDGEDEDGQ